MTNNIDMELEELRRLAGNQIHTSSDSYPRVFCIDTSGSMLGKKLDMAKKALSEYIRSTDGLVLFNSFVELAPHSKIPYITAAGNTAMLGALQMSVELKCSHIILATDGYPSYGYGSGAEIIDYVASLSGVKIDAIAISHDCDTELLKRICEITGGQYEFIDCPEQIGSKMKMLAQGPTLIA